MADVGPPPSIQEVMDDLAMRFVVNCPAEEQESFERLLFQVEAAFWFYDDQYREVWPDTFVQHNLLSFSQQLFKHCSLLSQFEHRAKEIYDAFTLYKHQIPTCGAALLNPSMTKVLLVKSYRGNSWGFPKGKIDKDEDKVSCAIREVYEEIGFDCSALIDENEFLEMQWQQQVMRLYVVPNVPESTVFETRTKKEIGEIAWHKIKDLPTTKEAAVGKLKPFWMVASFVARLNKWLEKQEKKKKHKRGARAPASGSSAELAVAAAAPAAKAEGTAGKGGKGTPDVKAVLSAPVTAPLGLKSSRADSSAKQVEVMKRGAGTVTSGARAQSRPSRGHAFLDFAFDRDAVIAALG
ncbi:hypothetical protein AB1Y20_003568 [Prymnesium parvum]|uniref:Nudix hydrolase domain-containing protein n=1 Tax=Prymnesium parvum TaxID=97485 RepID=A0AB34J532_PRYPA